MTSVVSPAVSVVVPTFNRAHLLPRCLGSVLAQSFEGFELIVVDDGSTDGTATVVEEIRDPRLRYLRQERAGAGAARNRGAAAAAAPLLSFLDSDDEVLPGWLERMLPPFEHPQVGLVFCGAHLCDTEGEVARTILPDRLGPLFAGWTGLFNDAVFVLRRQLFEAVGGYLEELRSSQHTELGFRLVDHCEKVGWRPHQVLEPLVLYHRHSGASIRRDSRAVLEGTALLLSRYEERLRRHPGTYVEYLSIAGTHAGRLGEHRLARELFARAIREQPAGWKSYLRYLRAWLSSLASRPGAGGAPEGGQRAAGS